MIPAGVNFSPLQAQNSYGTGQRSQSINPVQDAIRILSFKIPTNVGMGGIAPQQLLGQSPSALGPQTQSASVQNWLRSLFGAQPNPVPGQGLPTPQLGAMPGAQNVNAAPAMPVSSAPTQTAQPPMPQSQSQFMPSVIFNQPRTDVNQAPPTPFQGMARMGFGMPRSM